MLKLSQICQYLKWCCDVWLALAAVLLSVLEFILDYLLGFHGDLDNTLMQIC